MRFIAGITWPIAILVVAGFVSAACFRQTQQYNSPIQSNSFGLSVEEWERLYGKPAWEDDGQAIYPIDDKRLSVTFYFGNAGSIVVTPIDGKPVSADVARQESKKFLPADSELVRRFERGGPVDLYYSDSLKGRFPDSGNVWLGGEPGNFVVQYVVTDGLVEYFIIHVGNRA